VLLWGGAFGFAGLTAAVLLVWVRVRFARTTPAGRLSALPSGGLEFQTDARPPAGGLLAWWVTVEAVHSPARRWADRRPLEPRCRFAGPPLRGVYAVTAGWELTDWFGFVRWRPAAARWDTTVTVLPESRPWRPSFQAHPLPGRIRSRKVGQRAGDPFDVRRYVPGDDLRRLHWPLYAHAGDLFVRTADPSPPPEGRWHLVLDPTAPSEEALDHRLALVCGWLDELSRSGGSWVLDRPGAGRWGPADPWKASLAALTPEPLDLGRLTLAPGSRLVTGPGTEAARGTLPLVVVPDPVPRAPDRRRWWSRR